jgi:hypothetical protein
MRLVVLQHSEQTSAGREVPTALRAQRKTSILPVRHVALAGGSLLTTLLPGYHGIVDDRADRDQNPSISTFDVLQCVIARIEIAGCRQCSEHRRQP